MLWLLLSFSSRLLEPRAEDVERLCFKKKTQPILAFYYLCRSNVSVWQFVTVSLLRNMNYGASLLGPFILVSMPGLRYCNKHPPCFPGRCQSNSHRAEPRIRSKEKQCYNKDLANAWAALREHRACFLDFNMRFAYPKSNSGKSEFCEGEKCFL